FAGHTAIYDDHGSQVTDPSTGKQDRKGPPPSREPTGVRHEVRMPDPGSSLRSGSLALSRAPWCEGLPSLLPGSGDITGNPWIRRGGVSTHDPRGDHLARLSAGGKHS